MELCFNCFLKSFLVNVLQRYFAIDVYDVCICWMSLDLPILKGIVNKADLRYRQLESVAIQLFRLVLARSDALSTCCHQLSRAAPHEFTHNRVTCSLCDSIVRHGSGSSFSSIHIHTRIYSSHRYVHFLHTRKHSILIRSYIFVVGRRHLVICIFSISD